MRRTKGRTSSASKRVGRKRRSRGLTRRELLRALAGTSLAIPAAQWLGMPSAHARLGEARRLIVFYFPDGVPGRSANGEESLWHPTGGETSFTLPEVLTPLEPWRDECAFINGLSMGDTDNGSHPGGTKKLLTGADGGSGESIDHFLARTAGADSPHRHVYLGVQANQNNASGDKHISYVAPNTTIAPEDDPSRAFERLFAGASGSTGGGVPPSVSRDLSVIDTVNEDLAELRGQLGTSEQARLDYHLESVREVERRLQAIEDGGGELSCGDPGLDIGPVETARIHDPSLFPRQMRDQIDIMVTAMACNITRVGVLQASHHTSELIMSRFADSEMYDPGYDMRSHQASHYGPSHDFGHREFSDFVKQRRWFVDQFAYLLQRLADTPEGDGSMLDYSVVWLCTEVSDGNTHQHHDMPFLVAGRAGGALRTGRLYDYAGRRHSDLLVSIARAMGQDISSFGWASSGELPGLLDG